MIQESPLSLARTFLVTGAAALAACTIWAAIDDPYKSDVESNGAAIDGSTDADGEGGLDASTDAGSEGGLDSAHPDADAGAPTNRAFDAGFVPNAIGAYGDTVYAVDHGAQVHVAYDASTTFTDFWTGDAGGIFLIARNGVAANAEGVFWTLSTGVRYCGIDAGNCGLLPSANAREIAASDSVVAWIDDTGVRTCTLPIETCTPATLAASKAAALVAAGPNAAVAWTDGGATIHLANGVGAGSVNLDPYEVDLMATDRTLGTLYWEGPLALGFLQFDGGGGPQDAVPLYANVKPTALFVNRGILYWSLATNNLVQHCRLVLDSGSPQCAPSNLAATGLPTPQTTHGIVVTSRRVLALVSCCNGVVEPTLVEWPVPPP